jgi:deazaflavin-dependent oxidoreductase (nitroreductase family)
MPVDPTRSLAPGWLPAFNRVVTNPIQRLWAPHLPPFAVVVHTGRRSGRTFETPVLAFPDGDRIAIGLTYGSRAQWVRNVLAADEAELIRRDRRIRVRNPRIVTAGEGEPLHGFARRLSRHMGVLVLDAER